MLHSKRQEQLSRLDGQTRLLLLVQTLFTSANALSGIFVNVYLWRAKENFATIGWFALSHQLFMMVTFIAAGKWVKERNKMNSLRLGVMLSAVFYLLVLLFSKQAADWAILLGAVQGLSSAFFWLAFNVVYFEVTDRENRDRFNGLAGLFGSAAGMFAPWLSGFLITHMADTSGYRLIFTLSLAIFVVGAIASFFLHRRPAQPAYEWFYGLNILRQRENPWRQAYPALMAQGMREGVFIFLIGLMVYIATKNELQLGNYTLISSAVSLVAFYFAGKWIKPGRRSIPMLAGAVAMTVVIIPFFWRVDYTMLLIFGIVIGLAYPLYSIPITSAVFDLIGSNDDSVSHRVEFVVLRETALNMGRMIGIIAFVTVVSITTRSIPLIVLMMALGSAPILSWWFLRRHLAAGVK